MKKKVRKKKKNEDEEISEDEESTVDLEESFIGRRIVLLSIFERKILLENQQKLHYLQNIYMYVHPTTSYICKHYTYYKMN